MRLRKKPWIDEALAEYRHIVFKGPDHNLRGCWAEIFGRNALLYAELGTGKGQFISDYAERYPEVNFVGIEAQQDVLYYAAKKVSERRLGNVRLIVCNITDILEIFAPGEVDGLFINFCDPWPKTRHAKRRLTYSGFLEKYRVILTAGGRLVFKTDNRPLFEYSLEQFAAGGLQVNNVTYDLHNSNYPENILTEYEAKFSGMGVKINRVEVIFP